MDRLAAFRGTYRGVQAARKLLWLDRAQGVAQGRVWHAARDAEPAPHGARHLLGEVLDVGNALGAGRDTDGRSGQRRGQSQRRTRRSRSSRTWSNRTSSSRELK